MSKYLNHAAKTLADWAYLAITKHFHKILKHEANVLKDQDPEELHQMRVGMRRLRSAITGFAVALDLPKKAGEKKVGKIAQILGTLRDIDVLEAALSHHYQPILPEAEVKTLEQSLTVLAKRRKKAFKEVEKTLHGTEYLKLKQAFQDWLEQPSYQIIGQISIHTVLPDLLLPQASRLLLHPGWLVGVNMEAGEVQIPRERELETVENLLQNQGLIIHDLRKETKRSRYNMELFTQFYEQTYQEYVKDIRAIQTVLGDIQDCFVLAEFLTDVFGSEIEKTMPTLGEQFRETRYQKWREWEILQNKFITQTTRQELHLTILTPTLNPTNEQSEEENTEP
jgi:CHAD domain-containing protein